MGTILVLASIVIGLTGRGLAEEARSGQDWCRTQVYYEQKQLNGPPGSPLACATEGPCDNSGTRDSWIPDAEDGLTIIRMFVHVFTNDDGSNAACTEDDVADAVVTLNSDFLPLRIQFEYEMRFVQSTQFRSLTDNEMNSMKVATALSPDSQINIFVATVEQSYSFGTFPWDSDATGLRGGVVMNKWQFAPHNFGDFTHEVGHNMGLWHTHHGVDEVTQCGACYERADGAEGDATGDFCSDTDPTPTNFNCGSPGGTDPCSGVAWGTTHFRNYMGYAPGSCYTDFSEHQWGRMHCWMTDQLSGWISGVSFSGSPTFGPAPLTVDFSGLTGKQVNEWTWDFGDGDSSDVADPTHLYSEPGYYTVTVSIETPEGTYSSSRPGFVSAHADTIGADDIQGAPGQQVRVEIRLANHVPVEEIKIPFTWAGPFNLTFDSISVAGLRTEYFESVNLLNYDIFNDRITVLLKASSSGTAPFLEPGNASVLSLFFKIPSWVQSGANLISVTSYGSHSPGLLAAGGYYEPAIVDGAVTVGCCKGTRGNIDNDPFDLVDLADLTRLIDFLFISFTPLACTEEANIDGDPEDLVDLGDLTRLIDYLFISFEPPPSCL
jgi:PKD repeat protein